MRNPIVSTLPVRPAKRKRIFAIRLTEGERAKIKRLAKQFNLPDSFMARHFILEAVAHHSAKQAEGIALGSRDTETK